MNRPEHLLLTSLGTSPRKTTYQLDKRNHTASFSPLALIALLPAEQRPDRIVALVTSTAADKALPTFEREAGDLGLEVERCDIPGGPTLTDTADLLEQAASRVPEGCRLTLDVTHGLRHHAFLFYSLGLYLRSLRGVKVEGVWYGMRESGQGEAPKPLVDLRPVLDLAEWFHAVRLFREQGVSRPIADLVEPLVGKVREAAKQGGNHRELHTIASGIDSFARNLREFSVAYESALPLELGRPAERLVKRLIASLPDELSAQVPLASELTCQIREAAEPLAFSTPPPGAGKWKNSIVLDEAELDRQRFLIERYLERDQLPLALGLMREWVVSRVVADAGANDEWLSRSIRMRAERRLGALASFRKRKPASPALTDEMHRWGRFWEDLGDLRNALHHHGMKEDAVVVDPKDGRLTRINEFWKDVRNVPFPTLGGGGGRVLITPQGGSPGVLFNALQAHRREVDRCLVICSEKSRPTVDEAVAQAGFAGEVLLLEMVDPHAGAGEIEGMLREGEEVLLGADEVIANMTGGTTMMGVAVQALVESAGRLDRHWRRFVLLDRRPPEEQRAKPWDTCEVHWLDKPEESAHDQD